MGSVCGACADDDDDDGNVSNINTHHQPDGEGDEGQLALQNEAHNSDGSDDIVIEDRQHQYMPSPYVTAATTTTATTTDAATNPAGTYMMELGSSQAMFAFANDSIFDDPSQQLLQLSTGDIDPGLLMQFTNTNVMQQITSGVDAYPDPDPAPDPVVDVDVDQYQIHENTNPTRDTPLIANAYALNLANLSTEEQEQMRMSTDREANMEVVQHWNETNNPNAIQDEEMVGMEEQLQMLKLTESMSLSTTMNLATATSAKDASHASMLRLETNRIWSASEMNKIEHDMLAELTHLQTPIPAADDNNDTVNATPVVLDLQTRTHNSNKIKTFV